MGVYTLLPNATNNLGGATLVGAGQLWQAWSDGSDASYADVSTGDVPEVQFPAFVIPEDEVVCGYQIYVRAQTITAVANQPNFTADLRVNAGLVSAVNLFETGPSAVAYVAVPFGQNFFDPRSTNFRLRINGNSANTTRFFSVELRALTAVTPRVTLLHPKVDQQVCQSPVVLAAVESRDETTLYGTAAAWMSEDQMRAASGNLSFDNIIANGVARGLVSGIVGGGVEYEPGKDPTTDLYTYIYPDSTTIAWGVQKETIAQPAYPVQGNMTGYLLPGDYYLVTYYQMRQLTAGSVDGVTGPVVLGPFHLEDDPDEVQAGTLGCDSWSYALANHDGTIAAELVGDLTYQLRLDETGTATFTTGVASLSSTCLRVLANARPWEYEMRAYRGSTLLFSGPVMDITQTSGGDITLVVGDRAKWLDRRVAPADLLSNASDATGVAEALVALAFQEDPTGAPTVQSTRSGAPVSRLIRARDLRSIGDAVRELGRSGLDWVTVGNTLYLYGIGSTAVLGPVGDGDLTITKDARLGADAQTRSFVRGAGGGPQTAPITGTATLTTDLPLVEVVTSEPTILDQSSADASAVARVQLLSEGFRQIDVTLTSTFPAVAEDLIPGRIIDLRVGGWRPAVGLFRLGSLSVRATAAGEEWTAQLTSLGVER